MLANKSVVVLIKNLEFATSESETRPSQNAFDLKTRLRPLKSGLETGLKTKTNLKYYNTICNTSVFSVKWVEWQIDSKDTFEMLQSDWTIWVISIKGKCQNR